MFIKLGEFSIIAFFIYITWYSEIWGTNKILLYGTVILAAIFILLDWLFVEKTINIKKVTSILKTYLIFGICSLISGIFVCINRDEFMSSMITYFAFIIVCLECWYVSHKKNDINWLLNTLKISTIICALQTIFFGQDYYNGIIVTTMSEMNNPNTLGFTMVIGIFTLVLNKENFERKSLINFLCILMFLYVIILTGSRKCLLAGIGVFVMFLATYLIGNRKGKISIKKFMINISLILVTIIAIIYTTRNYANTSSYTRLINLFDEGGTTTRVNLYKLAVEYWKINPVFGIGFDQYKILNPIGYYSHSTYAEILSCTGLVGCLIFFIPILKRLIFLIRKSTTNSDFVYKYRICLIMLLIELFMGIGQIFIYNILHLITIFITYWVSDNIFLEEGKNEKV